jgi:hypothetical protein
VLRDSLAKACPQYDYCILICKENRLDKISVGINEMQQNASLKDAFYPDLLDRPEL